MNKFALACLVAASFCSLPALSDDITGYVSESHCGAKHTAPSDANTKCVNACLKGGSDPVLVINGKVMTFDGDSKEKARAYAGQNVKIDGSMTGDSVKINSIDKAQ